MFNTDLFKIIVCLSLLSLLVSCVGSREKPRPVTYADIVSDVDGINRLIKKCDSYDNFSRHMNCVRQNYFSNVRVYDSYDFFRYGEKLQKQVASGSISDYEAKNKFSNYKHTYTSYQKIESKEKSRSRNSKLAEIVLKGLVAGVDSYNDSMSRSSRSSSSSFDDGSCSSDYSCPYGQKCVKPQYRTTGTCMKVVDNLGVSKTYSPNSGSIQPNFQKKSCRYLTDCPINFRCDLKYSVCVKR